MSDQSHPVGIVKQGQQNHIKELKKRYKDKIENLENQLKVESNTDKKVKLRKEILDLEAELADKIKETDTNLY